MNIVKRVQAPTPGFFKKLRNISLVLAGVGGVLLGAPALIPAIILKLAAYLVVAGSVGAAVSQAVTPVDEQQGEDIKDGK